MERAQKNPQTPTDWSLNRRRLLQGLATGTASASLVASGHAATRNSGPAPETATDLRHAFADPPAAASPGAYWYWLGGAVTAEGITADLEAMRDAGIRRPMLFSIGKSGPHTPISPPADALTPHWWDLVIHAAKEAKRLGLELGFNFCDGWATASGPWITPEISMQYLVSAHCTAEGGRKFSGTLPQPKTVKGYYRDVKVLALPFPAAWEETSSSRGAKIATSLPLKVADPQAILDPENKAEIVDTTEGGWISYTFEAPFTLRSVTVRTPSPYGYAPGVYRAANSLEVQASDDGEHFRTIGKLEYPRHGWQTDLTTLTHAVPQTTARHFRLVHHPLPADMPYEEEYDFGQDPRLRFFSISLSSEPRIHHLPGKCGEQWAISRPTTAADVPADACIPHGKILDLTKRVGPDGRLDWDAPAGRWRILRIGVTTTGKTNSAAGGAQGLECDRFNKDAVRLQFDHWFGNALAKLGPDLAGKIVHILHVDSWEAGAQNWSPCFAEGFRRLRGYDLTGWLAVMAGVPVDSAETSERILFDVRRTINELTNENFFRTVADLAHAQGCIFSAEPANPTYFCDGLDYARYVDFPMGEFWLRTPRNDKPTDIKDAVNGGRLYGRREIGAESFTEGLMDWREHPYVLKPVGDHNFCEGINRLMLHVYAQQPWTDQAPGMTLNGIGTFFSRTQTWWKAGKAWFDYLRRCQAVLQSGRTVCDICYFTGEDVPSRSKLPRQLPEPLPPGFAYDCVNRDGLMRLARVEKGMLALAGGGRYRFLVLPESETMTPQLIKKLRELVRQGATVVGPRPLRSPSWEFGDHADELVARIAGEMWGPLDGKTRTTRAFGRGRIVWGKPLADILAADAVSADVAVAGENAAAVEWLHRQGPGWDAYYLCNPSERDYAGTVAFRVQGRTPEVWDADSGTRTGLAAWRRKGDRTEISLHLEACGSRFVVFARPASGFDPVVSVSGKGPAPTLIRSRHGIEAIAEQTGDWTLTLRSGGTRRVELRDAPGRYPVAGPWTVGFTQLSRPRTQELPGLVSWTELKPDELRYYSGTADYAARIRLPEEVLGPDCRLLLDLGTVHDIASLRINGQPIVTLWKPPFVADVTGVLREGENRLEIAVTNTWRNRLIGDTGKSAADRVTRVEPMLRKGQPWLPREDKDLLPAGLIGPVIVRVQRILRPS